MFTDRRAGSLAFRRVRQSWPDGKVFKILSLDGGGIKGIYSAQFLARCEQELTAGKPLASYFDMIAGTSTGGIIALGLDNQVSEVSRADMTRMIALVIGNVTGNR